MGAPGASLLGVCVAVVEGCHIPPKVFKYLENAGNNDMVK